MYICIQPLTSSIKLPHHHLARFPSNNKLRPTQAIPFRIILKNTKSTAAINMEQEQKIEDVDVEWEEWDGSSPFLHHCIAGSIAGVSEHTLLYPMDTIKTHMQSYCAQCPVGTNDNSTKNMKMRGIIPQTPQQLSMLGTFRDLMGANKRLLVTSIEASSTTATTVSSSLNTSTGFLRLWRGVQTIAIGCIPAHALYFSCYEATKHGLQSQPFSSCDAVASAVAGATATVSHDIIMAPLDTIKQRLQLGHYDGRFLPALTDIYKHEGLRGLFRSFPITLFTNVPYGIVMVTTNDLLKDVLQPQQHQHQRDGPKYTISTCLIAGSAAGCVASAITTPLDRVKTRLQTQALGIPRQSLPDYCKISHSSSCPKQQLAVVRLRYDGFRDALQSILKEEGLRGLFRGLTPRVLSHTPAVAISWTAYEMAKNWLAQL